MRLRVGPAALALLGGTLLCACGAQEAREVDLEFPAGADLEVNATHGAVQVSRGTQDHLRVSARLSSSRRSRVEQAELEARVGPEGALTLGVRWPGGSARHGDRASFTIQAPHAGRVKVRTTNGNVDLTGLGSHANLSTTNGRITVRDVDGDVDAMTRNGRIEVHGAGNVKVRTSNARVVVRGARGTVDAQSTNGRLELALTPQNPGPLTATTSNGSARIQVGPAFRGNLEVRTTNGTIRVDDEFLGHLRRQERRRAELDFGPGQDSRVTTTNGSVRVVPAP